MGELLEAQEEFTKSSNSCAQKQLEKAKKRLLASEKVSAKEIEKICKLQRELVNLGLEQREAQIEIY